MSKRIQRRATELLQEHKAMGVAIRAARLEEEVRRLSFAVQNHYEALAEALGMKPETIKSMIKGNKE